MIPMSEGHKGLLPSRNYRPNCPGNMEEQIVRISLLFPFQDQTQILVLSTYEKNSSVVLNVITLMAFETLLVQMLVLIRHKGVERMHKTNLRLV